MADRFPGGVISKTPPEIVAPVDGEGGSASGVWTLDEQLGLQKAGSWPKPVLPRELYAWGSGGSGRLGQNDLISKSSPVQVGSLTNWSDVNTGLAHTLAIKTDGTLWAWGENNIGRLGDGSSIDKSSPVQIGALTNWSQVAAGNNSSAAIKTDGTLWTWGSADRGQLGNNISGILNSRSSPIQVGALSNWSQVSMVYRFCHAIKTDGTLWAWGINSSGYLGTGNTVSRSSPVQIGALTNWSTVSHGQYHTLSIKTDGTLWAWGSASNGALGNNAPFGTFPSPIQVGSLTTWAQASGGRDFTIATTVNGALYAWGQNTNGALGDETRVNKSSPIQVGALTDWSQVSGGVRHSSAIKTDGTLWSWGDNSPSGQLGIGDVIDRSSPVQVGALNTWMLISMGALHGMAITKG